MVIFKRLLFKNLASYGNDPVELNLDASPRTMIFGPNGSGKSSCLDALSFALFGRYFKKANKQTLINSINGKNLLTEIEFETKGKTYLIRRGIKPNVFEIYMDGTLINQTASSKDYQKYIEENVLNLNFNSFKQIVVLGSNNFVPFMRLSAAQRREIIEDLLDISVFSRMNILLKEQMNETRESLKELDDALKLENEKILLNEQFMDSIRQQKDDRKEKAKQEIERLIQENEKNQSTIEGYLSKQKDLVTRKEKFLLVIDKLNAVENEKAKLSRTSDESKKTINFFTKNDHCPTCKQTIDSDFKADEIDRHQICVADLEAKMTIENVKMAQMNIILEKKNAVFDAIDALNKRISELQSSNHINNKYMTRLEKDLQDETTDANQEMTTKANLKKSRKRITELQAGKNTLINNREIENIAAMMLKDTGLKTAIIHRYVPYMNELINEYLTAMDFYVSFHLDENFQESIKSRYRDDFSYENFSEGEKQRIDLAILFAWRQIAKKKNSMATNLLILDEVGDSSLDEDGIKYVFEILRSMGEDTNIIVISHRETMVDNFDRVLKVSKKGNFSTMESF